MISLIKSLAVALALMCATHLQADPLGNNMQYIGKITFAKNVLACETLAEARSTDSKLNCEQLPSYQPFIVAKMEEEPQHQGRWAGDAVCVLLQRTRNSVVSLFCLWVIPRPDQVYKYVERQPLID